MSLGGGSNPFVDDGVQKAIEKGVVTAVAAGNDNANACNYSPSKVPTVSIVFFIAADFLLNTALHFRQD